MTLTVAICGASIFVALVFAHYLAGAEKLLLCALGSAALGIGSLLLLNVTGLLTGVSLPLSLLTLGVSMAGGPSGVALLLILNTWIV
ncbi:MAG: pro-sigmaK processing inhibitor BofA family protein [Oscillospiraceae bacterium]|nr:pro-sigmaK processing inhibitor BofA family protein [Oscillospiraceae bacterium]